MVLAHSLTLRIIAFVAVIFIIFAYFTFKAEERQMMMESKRMAEILSIAIYRGLSDEMLEGEDKMQKIQEMIEGYASVDEIYNIRIFDPEDNSILLDADEANIGKTINQKHSSLLQDGDTTSALFVRDNKQILSVITPITNGPKCYQCHEPQKRILGALDVDMLPMGAFASIARSRTRIIQFALLAIVAVSLAIVLLVIYFVNRPVKNLIDTMSKVESGDLGTPVQITDRGQLGKLSKSFNSMTGKVRADIQRLEALHKTADDFRSTMDLDEIETIAVRGISEGLGFERIALLLVDQEKQTLEGKVSVGIAESIVKYTKIPLSREYGILAETVLDAKPFSVRGGIYDISLAPEKGVKCWEFCGCKQFDCPAYDSHDLRCWLQSGTHCLDDIQRSIESKISVCCQCPVLREAYGKKAALVLMMLGSQAFATVPLMAQDKVVGVVMADNLHNGRSITDEDIKGLSIFAAQAGMAIENAKLYDRLENRIELANEELRQKITALTEMKNFNDSILQNMSNGLMTIDIEGKIVYFNAAAEAILGYQAQEVQGRLVKDLFKGFESLLSKTLQTGKNLILHETEVSTKAGINTPVEVSTSLLRDDADEMVGIVLIFADLTERKKMEEQIRRADRLATLGQLAAGIAHEIRNPLAGISGAAQILRDDILENYPNREILDEIIERINTLNTAISNFLRFARPAPLQLSPTDINEVVQSVLFLISKQAQTQGVNIVVECENSLPIVMADSEQLQQMVLNMALNALQAIGERDGRVLFKTYKVDASKQVVIRISDTGVGIPAEELDQIFDPYFTTKVEGTGLGLSIAQRIIEEHGGSISVESEVDEGTTFEVSLKYG
jgi:PAS domain S-box-containing protein